MNRFDGKVALVSGGLGAMGLAVGRRLAAEGARVVLADLADSAADGEARTREAFAGLPAPAVVALDVTQAPSWEAAIAETQRRCGSLDVLVNNAGVISQQTEAFDQIDPAEWQRLFAINVDGVFHGVQAAMRAMKAHGNGGAIVNMGSISGFVGSRDGGAYGSSKGTLQSLTKQAALSAARFGYNVRVNAVHPGYVWTPLVEERLVRQFGGREAAMEAVRQMNPMNRIVTPEDVAAAVAFLASDDARMITGIDLIVDGGRLIQ